MSIKKYFAVIVLTSLTTTIDAIFEYDCPPTKQLAPTIKNSRSSLPLIINVLAKSSSVKLQTTKLTTTQSRSNFYEYSWPDHAKFTQSGKN